MYTTHGNHIPGTNRELDQPVRVKCGGFEYCEACLREAAKVYVDAEKNHHHILSALTPKNAAQDQKLRAVFTNAIAWTFYGDETLQQIDVNPVSLAQCRMAAERCMVQMREFLGVGSEKESPLVRHARRELALIDQDPDIHQAIIKAVEGFATYRNSGGSAGWAIHVLYDLLQFKNLTPLTDDPEEWNAVAEVDGETTLWQSRRNAAAFSDDGGKTYLITGEDEIHESEVRGGSGQESAPDEHEPEEPSPSQDGDAQEAPEEGLHTI
jgi:hypothetical protein